jgi:hypothetical protein
VDRGVPGAAQLVVETLHRRLDRLAQRHALSAGRWIVVEVHDSRVHDDALLDATLADAGISRTDQDLVVVIKRYGPTQPSHTLRPPVRDGATPRPPRSHAMTAALQRRIAELEKKQAGPLRQRVVWWKRGEPKPQAGPGERLTIISWMWEDEESTEPPSTAGEDAP